MRDNTPTPDPRKGEVLRPKNTQEFNELLDKSEGNNQAFFGIKGDRLKKRIVVEMDMVAAKDLIIALRVAHSQFCSDPNCPVNLESDRNMKVADQDTKDYLSNSFDGMNRALSEAFALTIHPDPSNPNN